MPKCYLDKSENKRKKMVQVSTVEVTPSVNGKSKLISVGIDTKSSCDNAVIGLREIHDSENL